MLSDKSFLTCANWDLDTVVILSGDHLYRMDYGKFLRQHYETDADITVSVIPCNRSDAEGFGLLKTNEDGEIVEFKEKPTGEELDAMAVDTTKFGLDAEDAAEKPFLASMGIYVFNYKTLVELLNDDSSTVDFGKEIIPGAIGKKDVRAYLFNDYWEDIGTIRAFYNSNLDLASLVPKFDFFNAESPIYTNSRYLPPSKIVSCDLGYSMISEGCILDGVYARNSIIGLRSRINEGTRIEDTIVMGADYYESIDDMIEKSKDNIPPIGIGSNTHIQRAIIDKNTRIGKNVRLVNQGNQEEADGDNYFIRDGIIIIPKNAVIPDGTVV